MFTRQIPDLIRQLQGHFPEPAIRAVASVLGNGASYLEHRGPIQVEVDGNFVPSIGDPPRGKAYGRICEDPPAALTAINRSGKFISEDCESDCVRNGLAFRAIGPSQFDDVRIDRLYVGQLLDSCGDPIATETPPDGTTVRRFLITGFGTGMANVVFGRIVAWNGTKYGPTGPTVAFIDFTATAEFSSRWKAGGYGWCVVMDDRNTITISSKVYDAYEIVWIETKSRWIEFMLIEPMTSQRADSFVLNQWGADDRIKQEPLLEVYDRMNKIPNAQVGYRGIAVYDEQADEYIPIEDDDQGIQLPPNRSIYCVKVTDGDRICNTCLFNGLRVEITGLEFFCDPTDNFTDMEDVWLYAPNWADVLPPNSFHWTMRLLAAYTYNGDTRPLYLIKSTPDTLDCLKIAEGATKDPTTCLYPGKYIEIDLTDLTCNDPAETDSACDITYTELNDVLIYIPNADGCVAKSGDTFVWGWPLSIGVGGLQVYFVADSFGDCTPIAKVGLLDGDGACGAGFVFGLVDDYPGYGNHFQDDPVSPGLISMDNYFELCARDGDAFFALNRDDEVPPTLSLATQIGHQCTDVAISLGGAGPCDVQVRYWNCAMMNCGTTSSLIDLTSIFCDCPCDGSGCGCPAEGDVVAGTICYDGIKICGPGDQVQECHNLNFSYDAQSGWWVADFSCPILEPILLREVLYHLPGEVDQDVGWAHITCNWDEENVVQLYDDFGNPIPNGIIDEFTGGIDDGFQILGVDQCLGCTRHYRVQFQCFENGFDLQGRPIIIINAKINLVAPPNYSDPNTTVKGGDTMEDAEFIDISSSSCTGFVGTFDGDFGREVTPDFALHTFCAFRTGQSTPGGFGIGTLTVFW